MRKVCRSTHQWHSSQIDDSTIQPLKLYRLLFLRTLEERSKVGLGFINDGSWYLTNSILIDLDDLLPERIVQSSSSRYLMLHHCCPSAHVLHNCCRVLSRSNRAGAVLTPCQSGEKKRRPYLRTLAMMNVEPVVSSLIS